MQTQVAATRTAQVVLLTAAGFLFYACGYLVLWFTAGLDVHELKPAGAYGNATASLSPSRPTEVACRRHSTPPIAHTRAHRRPTQPCQTGGDSTGRRACPPSLSQVHYRYPYP